MDAVKMAWLDFWTMKVYWKNYLIILAYPVLFSWWSPSTLIPFCCAIFGAWTTSIFSVEEKNDIGRLHGVLGLNKHAIVTGRYLYALATCLGILAVFYPLYLITTAVTRQAVNGSELILSAGTGFLVFWLMTGIQIPLFFRFPYTKARIWAYLPFMLFALVPLFSSQLSALAQAPWVRSLVAVLEGAEHNPLPLTGLLLAAGCLIAAVSYLAARILYRPQKG